MTEDLSGLTLVELFDRLVQPEAPATISMMPQTAGWIWLGMGLACLIVMATFALRAWRRAKAYRRAALAELAQAGGDAALIAQILRRTALSRYPRKEVAGLHGEDWLAFLDSTSGAVHFGETPSGHALIIAPYRPHPADAELPRMAAKWIRTHKALPRSPRTHRC